MCTPLLLVLGYCIITGNFKTPVYKVRLTLLVGSRCSLMRPYVQFSLWLVQSFVYEQSVTHVYDDDDDDEKDEDDDEVN